MNLRDAPIQRKLTMAIMLTSTVVLFLTAAVFIGHEVRTFRQTLEENSRTIARITAAQSSGAVDYENENDCRKILSKLNSEPSILLAALYGRHGKMLARHPGIRRHQHFSRQPCGKGVFGQTWRRAYFRARPAGRSDCLARSTLNGI